MSDKFEYDPESDGSDLKTFSAWSIAALILAVLSFFYLINSQLVILPLLAILCSLIAFIRIASSGNQSGQGVAITALFIATFVFASSVSYQYLRHQYMVDTAQKHCATWLKMVQEGDVYRTHQLTYAYPERQDVTENLEVYYSRTEPPKFGEERGIYLELDHYTTVEPELTIRSDGTNCELIDEGLIYHSNKNKREKYTMRYRLKRADKSLSDRIFNIQMMRTNHYPPIGPQWSVSALENIDPPIERKLPRIEAPK